MTERPQPGELVLQMTLAHNRHPLPCFLMVKGDKVIGHIILRVENCFMGLSTKPRLYRDSNKGNSLFLDSGRIS